MPLRGPIQDFGLADVLQLIAKAHRSGYIRLTNDIDEVTVTVKEGRVLDVVDEGRPGNAKLGNRLVRAGLLTNAELGQALKRRVETNAPIAHILEELRLATRESIVQYATMEATDALFDIFTWERGTYEFEETAVADPDTAIEPIPADALLMQGIVLVDEWPTIKERIPSERWRVARRFDLPPEPEPEELPMFGLADSPENPTQLEVGPNERVVHELCAPGHAVRTIADRAPFHRFETFRCLSHLIGFLYIELVAP
ncbi:MAG: DUF4388 domain-containing protein [Deltaproteobacteria bacterium]|jgi:hypothetical protein